MIFSVNALNQKLHMHDPRWDSLTDDEWHAFAKAWNSELKGTTLEVPLPDLPWMLDDPPELASDYVVPMNFSASANAQWKFIVAAFRSGDDDTFGHLAAGPVEHLLGTQGEVCIEAVEQMAADDPQFAKMLQGCFKYQMTDEVWRRVRTARGDSQ